MGRNDLLSRLNAYYEELSSINTQIELAMRETVPPAEKITGLLNRKDALIAKCIHIKQLLDRDSTDVDDLPELRDDDAADDEEARRKNNELLEKMLNEEQINRELAEKHLQSIRQEIHRIRTSKNKISRYNRKRRKSGASIDKKV